MQELKEVYYKCFKNEDEYIERLVKKVLEKRKISERQDKRSREHIKRI
ncbi:hypothetical protein ACSXAY_18530 (plasmid) [Clostridium perfringens]